MIGAPKRWLVTLTLLVSVTGPPSTIAATGSIAVATPGAFRTTGGDLALPGATMQISERNGGHFTIRIDWTETDPSATAQGITLAGVSYRRSPDEAWRPLCKPDHEGRSAAFPIVIPGQPGFSIACTSDARGKCARFGYRPWATTATGAPLLPLYEACLRMVRADYCGTGESHTRPGVPIRMWDEAGIRSRPAGARAEASWTPSGAACVRRARSESTSPLSQVTSACPEIATRIAPSCDATAEAGAILWSEAIAD